MFRTDSARAKIAMACVVWLELIVPELRLPWRVLCMVRTDSARAKISMACVVWLELIVPELRLPWRVLYV